MAGSPAPSIRQKLQFFPRLRSAWRYLRRADPPWRWRIYKGVCPNCRHRWFLALRPDAFMTRCLSCRANLINLSLIPVIENHSRCHNIKNVWEMSTYGATRDYLRQHFPRVSESEFFPGIASGQRVHGILNEDVQQTSFADESLDLITSNQVFEHVEDDIRGYQECCRILKPGGALIFSVPLYDIPATRQLASRKGEELHFHETPEYHDSRLAGPGSALCFWRHSVHDICARVATAGFSVSLETVKLATRATSTSWVVYAVKNQRC